MISKGLGTSRAPGSRHLGKKNHLELFLVGAAKSPARAGDLGLQTTVPSAG